MKIVSLFAVLYCCILSCYSEDDLPELETSLGRVQGTWKTSMDGRKFASFEGIPYAEPPVGNLRFEEPRPIKAWSGLLEANNPRMCPQSASEVNADITFGVEDCLYLNVYVPAEFLDKASALDVVVSIHGGGFKQGSAHMMTLPELFMDKDIVLVSINYRLGVLGFLTTGDGVIPGNNGMKDQSLALKWVKDNIESFGGNSESVTIIGLSAGGASVHLHYFSPLSKGLFHRGISQSGTAIGSWAINKNPLESARKLATLAGCSIESTLELKTCLQEIPVLNLLQAVIDMNVVGPLPNSFVPIIEKNSEQPFLDENPYLLLKQGKVADVPWITSQCADEGLVVTSAFWSDLEDIDEHWSEYASYILDWVYTLPESKQEKASTEVLNYYLGSGEKINKENFKKFTQMLTDRTFGIPAQLAAKMQANVTESPVYYYFFNYEDGENSLMKTKGYLEIEGVSHGDDMYYLYGVLGQQPFSEQDKLLKEAFHNMLYSYITTNKPSFDGTDLWQPTSTTELTYLNITGPEDMEIYEAEDLGHYDFWSKLGIQEYENLVTDKL